MNIGVAGCGLIGNRRARLAQAAGDTVLLVADLEPGRARETAAALDSEWTDDWQALVADPRIEVVVVSTINKSLLPVTLGALAAGKHVLCEKPLGRNAQEAKQMVDAARAAGRLLKVGFNHRFHPGVWRAHELAVAGAIGPLISIRAAYGHGGRPGYDQEWRANADLAGGGELLDQGVHIVDLCRWFLGEFVQVGGMVSTGYWQVAPLEDNGFALLRAASGATATLHTSWTQWKNLFRFELFGRDGYLFVDGLGGSYGVETLTLGRRQPQSGPPEEERWTYPGEDDSWAKEWAEFRAAISEDRPPLGDGEDGLAAARVIDAIYQSAREGRFINLAAPS